MIIDVSCYLYFLLNIFILFYYIYLYKFNKLNLQYFHLLNLDEQRNMY